jgi:hypothetical protein
MMSFSFTTRLRFSQAAVALENANRLHHLQVALHERDVVHIFNSFRSNGIEPILIKGWAIARIYPERALRPYGDLDLYVPAEQLHRAESLLKSEENRRVWVDLHEHLIDLCERSMDQLYARSQIVNLDGTALRLLSTEDQFRLMCMHTLRHGVWRPLWLADVAVAVESLPENFAWDYCLRGVRIGSPAPSDWPISFWGRG